MRDLNFAYTKKLGFVLLDLLIKTFYITLLESVSLGEWFPKNKPVFTSELRTHNSYTLSTTSSPVEALYNNHNINSITSLTYRGPLEVTAVQQKDDRILTFYTALSWLAFGQEVLNP